MALDKEYFEKIDIQLVKKKYYNAAKVHAVLEDISSQAIELTQENERMKKRLAELEEERCGIGDAVISAQSLYRATLKKANDRAAEIIAEATAQAAEIVDEAKAGAVVNAAQQERIVHQVETLVSSVKELQLKSIEALNEKWQSFLCGICVDENEEQSIPTDMEKKISAIAREMLEIGKKDN